MDILKKCPPYQDRIVFQKILYNTNYDVLTYSEILVDETKKVKKIKKGEYLENGECPIIDQGQEDIGGYTDIKENIYKNTPFLIFGDHTRIIKFIEVPSFIGADGVKVLNINENKKEKIDIRYLYYYLLYSNIPNDGYSRHFKYIKNLLYIVPPIEIQKQIVEILDEAQRLIDNRKEQIKLLDDLIESIFYDMFGDPVKNEKEWEVKKIRELSSLVTKGSSPNWQGIEYVNDNSQVLFVTSENVREGYLDLTKSKYLQNEFNEKQKRSILEKGDFLINIVGASIGRACKFDMETKANINQAVSLVRLKEKCINDEYLLIFLNSESALLQYENMKVSVARANLSLENIKDLEILFPPIQLQNQFAAKVEVIQKQKQLLEDSLKLLEDNYNNLVQRAFKGELF